MKTLTPYDSYRLSQTGRAKSPAEVRRADERVSPAPLEKLQAYKQRMGWTFPWASSDDGEFNFDFEVSMTEEQQRTGSQYNFRRQPPQPPEQAPAEGPLAAWAAATGTDWLTYTRERPGMSSFALENGAVYHTYSTYERGLDTLWGMYQCSIEPRSDATKPEPKTIPSVSTGAMTSTTATRRR